ncbi:hypothetical protein CDAR_537181 [Caerostris darwini]|uniref:Uncharacterized protein n=1 Tax=Caerostris darwini TaxID=1538125 RepID=A0AAV4TXD5_9ARAC|nr:hypothetical protein CDAR_537181 [Caerostris darwini]
MNTTSETSHEHVHIQRNLGDRVYMILYPVSKLQKGKSAKLIPHFDGHYLIPSQISSFSYEIPCLLDPQVPIGVYHFTALKYFHPTSTVSPIRAF